MSDIIEGRSETAVPTSAVYANLPAWHEIGTVIDTDGKKGLTIVQALPLSGLDFTVSKVPIFGPKGQPIDNRWGVQREDTEEILGVVGNTWQPVQNLEGLAIINDLVTLATEEVGYKLWIESAFALDNGRKVCVLIHINDDWQIAGEKYVSYLMFSNGHDGRLAVSIAAVDMRAVCGNTQNFALFVEGKETGRVARVRHTNTAGDRLREASNVLKMRNVRKEELAKQGEWLVEQTMSDGEFANFLESLMPLDTEQADKPAGTMIRDRRALVAQKYFDAPNLDPIRGTRWGALQAVVEYADYGIERKSIETAAKQQLGFTPAKVKTTAMELLLA
jgi:phage/plasmid-like protein (TIGR03299 family)